MRNRNPKMVEIIWNDSKTNFKFKCRVCKRDWWPKWTRLSWQCPRGCKEKDLEEMKGD